MKSDAVDGRNLDRSADFADQPAHIFIKPVKTFQNIFRFAVKDFARRRQFDFAPSAHALQKSAFEAVFKCPNLLADG